MKKRIGVIFGGKSVEHEVSVISAIQAINNIDREKYEIVPIYISKDRIWYVGDKLFKIENYKNIDNLLSDCKSVSLCKIDNEFCLLNTKGIIKRVIDKIDIAFPIVHGKNVEDGSLVGLLETIGIPYVGSEVLGAALGQDKVVLKQILRDNNIPVINYVWFYDEDYLEEKDSLKKKIKELGYPVIVKPANLGSSVGIKYVNSEDMLEEAIEEAIEYDRKILVEKALEDFTELNCSVLGNYKKQETSEIEEVMSDNDILTYDDKYIGGNKTKGSTKGMVNTSRIIPARITKENSDEIHRLSKLTFRALNLSGVCRIDFLLDNKNNKVYVNEPNIIPGSLSFYLWEPIGKEYKKLLDELIQLALNNYRDSLKKTNSFDTSLLSNFDNNKGFKTK